MADAAHGNPPSSAAARAAPPDEEQPADGARAEESSMLLGLGDALRARVGSATMRSVSLLRGEEADNAERLRAELEAWLLEAGRMEAVVDDALKGAGLAVAEREEAASQARAEAVACRRALELHIARKTKEASAEAQHSAEGVHQRESQLLQLQAELAQARAEVQQMGEQHGRRLREAQLETEEATSREAALLRQIEDERALARQAGQASAEAEEEARRAWAQCRLAEAAAAREDDTRRACGAGTAPGGFSR